VPSYALESTAPHLAATNLWRLVQDRLQAKQRFPRDAGRDEPIARLQEELFLATLRNVLRREIRSDPESEERPMPFVDAALAAQSTTWLELAGRVGGTLFPDPATFGRAFERWASECGGARTVAAYFARFVAHLVRFSLTQTADRLLGIDSDLPTLAERDRLLFDLSFADQRSAEETVARHLESEEELGVAAVRGAAREVASLPFVARRRFPKRVVETILCGSEARRRHGTEDPEVLYLDTSPSDGNIRLRRDWIEAGLGAPLTAESRDLLELGAYLYCGDLLVRRTARWRRSLRFVHPVSDLERWRAVAEELSVALSFVSGDHVVLEPVPRRRVEMASEQSRRRSVKRRQRPAADCVCLLSGGLDSYAGAVDLVTAGRRPLFVSHFRQGRIAHRQRGLLDRLQRLGGKEELADLSVDLGLVRGQRERIGIPTKLERTQRLRSILYLTLSTVAALELGCREVFIPENGILALNEPLAECYLGTRSTRTAHPRYLFLYEECIRRLLGKEIRIRNPLLGRTKSEVLASLDRKGLRSSLAETITCSRYAQGVMTDPRRRGRPCTHCGACIACLVRRAAMLTTGLERFDASYVVPPFRAFGQLTDTERSALLHLVAFCRSAASSSEEDWLLDHAQLNLPSTYLPDLADPPAGRWIADLYRRFAEEVMAVVANRGSASLRRIVELS